MEFRKNSANLGGRGLRVKNVVSLYMLKSTVFIHSYRCKKGNVGLDCF